jgi:tyrosine-protein kinase Etk/Wzc
MSRIYDALKKAEQDATKRTFDVEATAAPAVVSAAGVAPSASTDTPAASAVPQSTAIEPNYNSAGTTVPAASSAITADGISQESGVAVDRITAKDKKDKKEDTRVQIFAPDGTELLGAEELRRLRTKLQHARDKKHIKSLLITSALPGEGKTFISVNLTQILTMQHRTRVLLIDADLRKPQVHTALGVPNENGLVDYLAGRCALEQIIKTTANGRFDFIVGGAVRSQPAELASSSRFAELISAVADHYEWIVVDTPPVLPVTDAAVIARCCDATLLVVAAGKTPGDLAQAAQKELKEANVIGVVLNRATTASSSYKHYYYNHYSHTAKAASTAAAR